MCWNKKLNICTLHTWVFKGYYVYQNKSVNKNNLIVIFRSSKFFHCLCCVLIQWFLHQINVLLLIVFLLYLGVRIFRVISPLPWVVCKIKIGTHNTVHRLRPYVWSRIFCYPPGNRLMFLLIGVFNDVLFNTVNTNRTKRMTETALKYNNEYFEQYICSVMWIARKRNVIFKLYTLKAQNGIERIGFSIFKLQISSTRCYTYLRSVVHCISRPMRPTSFRYFSHLCRVDFVHTQT